MEKTDQCCGFGGTFAVKYPEISGAIVEDKVQCIEATKAPTTVCNDAGCTMNISGMCHRHNVPTRVRHIAELMAEAMGLHMPAAAFVNPGTKLRQELTRAAVHRLAKIGWQGDDYRPLGHCVDERAIVNAAVALMSTGGSTNHTIHWLAVARAAGIVLTWDDLDELSQIVPLLTRVYPNGEADVNHFAAAGGVGFVFRELMDAGLMHDDLATIVPGGMRAYGDEPCVQNGALASGRSHWNTPLVERQISRPVGGSSGFSGWIISP
jgi:hypothetical protein